jgi:lipoprotein
MKDKIKAILSTAILVACFLTAVGVRYYQQHMHDKEIAFAKAEAEDHLAEKYGIEDISLEQIDAFITYFGDKDDYRVAFSANCGGEEFRIIYFKNNGKAECFDDYQYEEIRSALEKYFCEKFPKGSVVSLYFHGKGIPYSGFMYKDVLFNGENITEILEKCNGDLEMVFYDTEFSQSDIEKVIPQNSFRVEFASFDTKEHCEEFLNDIKKCEPYDYYFYKGLEKYAPHLTDYIKMNNNDVSGYDITILENDEFRYAYFPVEPRKLVTRTDITAEPVEKSKVTEIFTRYGEENSLGKPLSKEYYFDSMYGDVWVYYPLEKLEGYDIENVGLAWLSAGGMSNNHNIEKAQICGEYAVFNMPFGEDYFMLVVTSGLEEYVPNYD